MTASLDYKSSVYRLLTLHTTMRSGLQSTSNL